MPDVIAFKYESRTHEKQPGTAQSMTIEGVYIPGHNSTVTRKTSGATLAVYYDVTAQATRGSVKRELEEMTREKLTKDKPTATDKNTTRTYSTAQRMMMPPCDGMFRRKAIVRLERDLSRGEYSEKVEAKKTIDRMIEATRACIEQNAAA